MVKIEKSLIIGDKFATKDHLGYKLFKFIILIIIDHLNYIFFYYNLIIYWILQIKLMFDFNHISQLNSKPPKYPI